MDIEKERKAFETLQNQKVLQRVAFLHVANAYAVIDEYRDDLFTLEWCEELNFGWRMWQAAKAQTIPEGFVLVPKEKLSVFWQDDDEPENIVSDESNFNSLGDCIELGDVMTIKKHTQANIETETLYGTWFAEVINPSEKANFFVGTYEECLDILNKNKAMIEAAQGEGHE